MKVQTRMGRGRRIWVCPVCGWRETISTRKHFQTGQPLTRDQQVASLAYSAEVHFVKHHRDAFMRAVLDGPAGGARGEADARERDAGTPQSTGSRAPLSDETLREVAKEWFVASEIPLAMAFARAVLARQQGGR